MSFSFYLSSLFCFFFFHIRDEKLTIIGICRLWPADPHARPTANDFKRVVRRYIKKCDGEFGKRDYNQMYHVSDHVETVEKPYGARIYRVPSVGVVFRWVEDADSSQAASPPPFSYPIPTRYSLYDEVLMEKSSKWLN